MMEILRVMLPMSASLMKELGECLCDLENASDHAFSISINIDFEEDTDEKYLSVWRTFND